MARARRNRGNLHYDPSLDITEDELMRGSQANREWHWFSPDDEWTQQVVEWDDDDLPGLLIECGRLIRIHVRAPSRTHARSNRHPRRQRDTMIQFSRALSNSSHIAFDPDHPNERLYFLLSNKASNELKHRLWDNNPFTPMPLSEVARVAGGRHARHGYPDVMVKPLGAVTAVVYQTHKKGDGPSYYIHQMAEISGKFPFLGVDNRGRLWLAGGNYTSPNPGITD